MFRLPGNYICIQHNAHGAQTYTPNCIKEFEKSTPGFDLMFRAISKFSEDIAAA
jgi:hypothetical protein